MQRIDIHGRTADWPVQRISRSAASAVAALAGCSGKLGSILLWVIGPSIHRLPCGRTKLIQVRAKVEGSEPRRIDRALNSVDQVVPTLPQVHGHAVTEDRALEVRQR